jgi:hypothetical protein
MRFEVSAFEVKLLNDARDILYVLEQRLHPHVELSSEDESGPSLVERGRMREAADRAQTAVFHALRASRELGASISEDELFGTDDGYEALRVHAEALGPAPLDVGLADGDLRTLRLAVGLLEEELDINRVSAYRTALFEAWVADEQHGNYELLDLAHRCGELAGAIRESESALRRVLELNEA